MALLDDIKQLIEEQKSGRTINGKRPKRWQEIRRVTYHASELFERSADNLLKVKVLEALIKLNEYEMSQPQSDPRHTIYPRDRILIAYQKFIKHCGNFNLIKEYSRKAMKLYDLDIGWLEVSFNIFLDMSRIIAIKEMEISKDKVFALEVIAFLNKVIERQFKREKTQKSLDVVTESHLQLVRNCIFLLKFDGVTFEDIEFAVRHFNYAFDFFREHNPGIRETFLPLQNSFYYLVGRCYENLSLTCSQKTEALEHIDNAIRMHTLSYRGNNELKDEKNRLTVCHALGSCFCIRAKLISAAEEINHSDELKDIAIIDAKRAIELFDEVTNSSLIQPGIHKPSCHMYGNALRLLGVIYSKIGDYEKAEAYFRKAIFQFNQYHEIRKMAECYRGIGHIYYNLSKKSDDNQYRQKYLSDASEYFRYAAYLFIQCGGIQKIHFNSLENKSCDELINLMDAQSTEKGQPLRYKRRFNETDMRGQPSIGPPLKRTNRGPS